MGLWRRGLIPFRCGILALLFGAVRRYSFNLVRPEVSSTVFILSLVSIGLSIVAFALVCLVLLTLGVGIALTTLGGDGSSISLEIGVLLATRGAAGCCFCGGFVVVSKVLCCCVLVQMW